MPRTSSDLTGDLVAPRNVSRISSRKASTSSGVQPCPCPSWVWNVAESAHSAHATRMAPLHQWSCRPVRRLHRGQPDARRPRGTRQPASCHSPPTAGGSRTACRGRHLISPAVRSPRGTCRERRCGRRPPPVCHSRTSDRWMKMSLTRPTRPSRREWHRSPSRQAVLGPGWTVDRLFIVPRNARPRWALLISSALSPPGPP